MNVLEGPVLAHLREVPVFEMEPSRFGKIDAEVEIPMHDTLDIPLDGIVGVRLLSACEWWFEDDDGVACARAAGSKES
jgi:hypothetical protein